MRKEPKGARKSNERAERAAGRADSKEPLTDPLSAFPADPPQQNWLLLVVSALLFAVWFCYLAWVALRS